MMIWMRGLIPVLLVSGGLVSALCAVQEVTGRPEQHQGPARESQRDSKPIQARQDSAKAESERLEVVRFVEQHCIRCHNSADKTAGLP